MATPTYTLIDLEVLASAAASVTFSSIPADYRDLVIVVSAKSGQAAGLTLYMQPNGDTGSNWNYVSMAGTTGGAATGGLSNQSEYPVTNFAKVPQDQFGLVTIQIMDYLATDKHKSVLVRGNNVGTPTSPVVEALAARWASTSAVTSLVFSTNGDGFATGSTFYLYGIEA
jgi:hypothetical protein